MKAAMIVIQGCEDSLQVGSQTWQCPDASSIRVMKNTSSQRVVDSSSLVKKSL